MSYEISRRDGSLIAKGFPAVALRSLVAHCRELAAIGPAL